MRITRRRTLLIVALVLILIVGGTIALTTFTSPAILEVQSNQDLNQSIFSIARSSLNYNISDSAGSYTFRFGFDFDTSIQAGSQTVFKVYAALTSEMLSSFFTRGVAVEIQSATLLIDDNPDAGMKLSSFGQPALETFLFEFVNTSLPAGVHYMTARMVLSTIDVDYVGYFTGASWLLNLNGTFSIVG